MIPIVGDFISHAKQTSTKDPEYWLRAIIDLIQSILAILVGQKIIPDVIQLF